VIVATSKGYVRFFSASGIQRYLWRVEEVVSMVAGREGLLVVHREGGTSLDGMFFFSFSFLVSERVRLLWKEG
jgi:chromosome transmission fidelity protein 4